MKKSIYHLLALLFFIGLFAEAGFISAPQSSFAGSSQVTLGFNTKITSNLNVRGSISKGSGTFVIDDPLDPSTELLYHSFVESPDVKNIYNGIATLDEHGEATVQLPEYFDALNDNVRYQFTPMGEAMPNLYIKTPEANNQFSIAGGVPGGEVSWQVTGIRHDPYILAHPIVPEVPKGPNTLVDKGQCLYPPLCQ